MNRLCLSAALLVLLVILVDGISEDINNSYGHGHEMNHGQQLTITSEPHLTPKQDKHGFTGYELTYRKQHEKNSAASKPAFCLKPKLIGPCKAKKIRFFYNAKTGHCQRFIYGGCKGNMNNFHTAMQCMKTCAHAAGSQRGHWKSHAPKL